MDSAARVTELERRCAGLEALNAQLARDLATAAEGGERSRGPAAAAFRVSVLDRRLDEALTELTTARAELAAAFTELAAAHANAEAGWGRYEELRRRRAVRWGLRLARILRR